jgi:hypothetical protein
MRKIAWEAMINPVRLPLVDAKFPAACRGDSHRARTDHHHRAKAEARAATGRRPARVAPFSYSFSFPKATRLGREKEQEQEDEKESAAAGTPLRREIRRSLSLSRARSCALVPNVGHWERTSAGKLRFAAGWSAYPPAALAPATTGRLSGAGMAERGNQFPNFRRRHGASAGIAGAQGVDQGQPGVELPVTARGIRDAAEEGSDRDSTGVPLLQRRRRVSIPAWGNAPGKHPPPINLRAEGPAHRRQRNCYVHPFIRYPSATQLRYPGRGCRSRKHIVTLRPSTGLHPAAPNLANAPPYRTHARPETAFASEPFRMQGRRIASGDATRLPLLCPRHLSASRSSRS